MPSSGTFVGLNLCGEWHLQAVSYFGTVCSSAACMQKCSKVSCASRDLSYQNGAIGYCGALVSEVVNSPGVTLC